MSELWQAEEGAGPPVVLAHAGGVDSRMWEPVVPLLTDRFRVIRYDLRGHGRSGLTPGRHSHIEDMLELLREVADEPVRVAGNSFGGGVALEAAIREPDRFASLTLLAVPVGGWDWDRELMDFWTREAEMVEAGDIEGAIQLGLDAWHADASCEERELVADSVRVAFAHERAAPDVEWADDDDSRPDLSGLTIPTVVGIGDLDRPDFQDVARWLAEAIPAARLEVLEGAGHLLPFQRPREVAVMIAGARGAGLSHL